MDRMALSTGFPAGIIIRIRHGLSKAATRPWIESNTLMFRPWKGALSKLRFKSYPATEYPLRSKFCARLLPITPRPRIPIFNISLQLFQYCLQSIVHRHRYIHGQRIGWLFKCIELTLEHMGFHIMIRPLLHARPDYVIAAFEIDELHIFIPIQQLLAVTFLKGRTCQHPWSVPLQTRGD